MSRLVPSPGSAVVSVTLLLGCAWLSSAAQVRDKGRTFITLTSQEEAMCPSASAEAFLNSTLTTRVLPALYSVVLLVGLPANALACWVVVTNFRRCSSTLFLLNLASVDLLFVLVLPLKISYHLLGNHWLFGEYLCRTMVALFYGNMYGSILFLTCISLERYISVVHPFLWKGSSWTWGKAGICMGIWLMVGLGMMPLLSHTQTRHISSLNITTCHDFPECKSGIFMGIWLMVGRGMMTLLSHTQTRHISSLNITTCHDFPEENDRKALVKYFLFLVGLGFGLPFVLVTISYSCILARLLAQRRHYGQVVRVLVLVLVVFILCFTPSNVLLFIHCMLEAKGCENNITYVLYVVALVLSAFNNCFDPFIYFYVSKDFRSWVWDTGRCCLGALRTSAGKPSEKAALPPRSSEQSQL
ncbi:PREDICTED: proteinase-activated receptor 3-like [Buceros rhinoceros silvestris]|uniref:proteinase-activated receptor 3-like n=1 Tax=Buceros rhinoceros silvestris TaxID=175836 RepID=UPI000528F303|nr:PREDICTED: proteinase-activated receptor 3-like [Buceros rhinoceros silvestris]